MKRLVYILLIGAWLSGSAQLKKHLYQDEQIKVEYQTRNGLLDGKYTSYYANGKKKAKGSFKNNLRVGKWQVWDSAGTVVERIIRRDTIVRNEDGFFPYPFFREKDVYLTSRAWRDLHKANNPLLFANSFADTLLKHILRDSIQVYSDEEFVSPIAYEVLAKFIASGDFDIVQYKLKEDWLIDQTRGRTWFVPLGICPVLIPRNSQRGETIHLGWLYFPPLRPLLASQAVADKEGVVMNLDDIFWYRRFNSVIYKETNVYNKPIASLVKSEKQAMREAERIALSVIEWEHHYWLQPDKPPFNYLYER